MSDALFFTLTNYLISIEFELLRERLRVKRLGLGFTKRRLLLVLQLSRVSIGALLPRRHGAGAAGQASAFSVFCFFGFGGIRASRAVSSLIATFAFC